MPSVRLEGDPDFIPSRSNRSIILRPNHLAPARVSNRRSVAGAIVSRRNRTEPSAMTAFVPRSRWLLKMPSVFGSGSTSQSSGLVQMTALSSPASTTMIVFDGAVSDVAQLDGLGSREDRRLAARGQVARFSLAARSLASPGQR